MVPKCKGCEHLFEGEAMTDDKILYTRLAKRRACKLTDEPNVYKVIESNEFKTSPKWCPLRGAK